MRTRCKALRPGNGLIARLAIALATVLLPAAPVARVAAQTENSMNASRNEETVPAPARHFDVAPFAQVITCDAGRLEGATASGKPAAIDAKTDCVAMASCAESLILRVEY